MAAPGLPRAGLCRGEGAPGGAAGCLADDAGDDRLPQQPRAACGVTARLSAKPRAVTTGVRST